MAVSKLSQISASGSNFTSGDFLVAVQSGTTDVLFSLAQAQFGIIGGISGTTVTTSQPVINLAQTWNAGGVTFTGLVFDVTDTASAAGSLLANFKVGGSTRFGITKGGTYSSAAFTDGVSVFGLINFGAWGWGSSIDAPSYFYMDTNGVAISDQFFYGWAGFGGHNAFGGAYTKLYIDDNYIIAQRNSTNAQTFRVYNTFTNTSNYERGVFDWTTTSNTLTIDVQVLGSGTQRVISLNHLDSATGAGTATFAATNCPATTLTSPYTWVKVTSSDGSIVYMPAWK